MTPAPDTAQCRQLGDQLIALCAGFPCEIAMLALADALAMGAAQAADTPDEAAAILRDLLPEMQQSVRVNWPAVLRARAALGCGGGRA
ncbi:hypothetical protein [Methylobacterium nodulans]|uniref:Uncharacterized protein n=1 Tax=Methylobacterium nodulans (strain LMG 21967 / CNCM I-2342 / ORS 2060) TaxID=460265 RepID=B8IHP7_METNO|nr:hypothetical protein [Methylobacterium nodulans]ACL61710.1 hypothetical protein Mnod_6968 [Methylobacterium nodulans ORS 2060]